MIWNSAADFWAMGGYGIYVWGSFGITALCMVIEAMWVKHARGQALTQVVHELEAQETQGKDWQT
jgi:heme exporter protein D